MGSRTAERRWLEQLTAIPTAPGGERRVLDWVRAWVRRRSSDLKLREDRHGNLLIRLKGRKKAAPVVAVAHTDHPGFLVTEVDGRHLQVEFRGGVREEYFDRARLEFFDSSDHPHRGTLQEFDRRESVGTVVLSHRAELSVGDIGRWSFRGGKGGVDGDYVRAPACDDLAGVAAALAALDRARGRADLNHFGVLLTRAEEVGFVGAIGAARDGTLPAGTRVVSIECSRSFADSPLGAGPVVRVGDASSVFDNALTNRFAEAAERAGVTHQRKLMAGGSCEATAFLAYGYETTGLCLPLGNYHNMGNLDTVEQGAGEATPMPEVVNVADYHGLVELVALATEAADGNWSLADRLDRRFEQQRHILR